MKAKTVRFLFFCHILALLFGLFGLLIALPHPQLWQNIPNAGEIFTFGIRYAGSLHILFGAATMLTFGAITIGKKKTLIFFCASTTISLSMELLGTSTGFPFGPYAYTDLLGYKILGHVPYAIPLSWFYMGLTAYLLANLLTERAGWRRQTLWSLLLGTYFLTVWDLSLDPSMANSHLLVQFWRWSTSGPYFGMPISNLIGWSVTGLLYMSISRFFWREQCTIRQASAWLPGGMYIANTGFAMLLALGAGLWQPLLIGAVLGLLPVIALLYPVPHDDAHMDKPSRKLSERISYVVVRIGSRLLLSRRVTYVVEGQTNLPKQGAVLLVARHFHHLYDGCLLLHAVPRRIHLLVGLDWITHTFTRHVMELACSLVQWPVVLRTEQLKQRSGTTTSAYKLGEGTGYLRRAVRLSLRLLQQGEVLVIFPEAYPALDPQSSPRQAEQPFLPFQTGFGRLVELAEAHGSSPVAIVPTGFAYQRQGKRWLITLRFGQPLLRSDFASLAELTQATEQRVHMLSLPIDQPLAAHAERQTEREYYEINPIQP